MLILVCARCLNNQQCIQIDAEEITKLLALEEHVHLVYNLVYS